MNCEYCNGEGKQGGCPNCGQLAYSTSNNKRVAKQIDFKIPSYYIDNLWESDKLVDSTHPNTRGTLAILDKLVKQTSGGRPINQSLIFLLPYGHGKKTAMFSIIQNYLHHGFTVAPVVDVVSLALMEHNFSLKRHGSVEQWERLLNSDLVCVYGVDFSARYQTMHLFHNLCSMRSLSGKPTLLFAESGIEDLRSMYFTDRYDPSNNTKDIGCRLANPRIFDGVTQPK